MSLGKYFWRTRFHELGEAAFAVVVVPHRNLIRSKWNFKMDAALVLTISVEG
jgi:hypothetical protein